MLDSTKNRVDLEKLNEVVLLQNQVKLLRLQDKQTRQNFHEDMNKVFNAVTETINDASEGVVKV